MFVIVPQERKYIIVSVSELLLKKGEMTKLQSSRTCPYIHDPFEECHSVNLASRNIEALIHYCGKYFEECEIYSKKGFTNKTLVNNSEKNFNNR